MHQNRASLPPLPALIAFEAVARRTRFAAAADELNLTPSAVSHQIAKLEQFLGVRLLTRNARGAELTEAGRAYLGRVGGALDVIGAATDDLHRGVRNALHVHASPSFASLWLMPRLSDFAVLHPGVSLSLSASPLHSDFSVGLVDLDIRYGVANWPNLIVQPVFDEQVMPLASPGFIDRYSVRTPDDLLQVPLIQSTVSVVQWNDYFELLEMEGPPERFPYRFDRAFLSLDAAVQGFGIALESTSIAAAHIEAGRLQPVFPAHPALDVQAHFIVHPRRHTRRPEVARFIEWLARRASHV